MFPFSHMLLAGYAAMVASASPASASGSQLNAGTCGTNSVTVSVSGGSGTFTHSWSADAGITVVGSGATVSFEHTFVSDSGSFSGTATDTITDTVSGFTTTVIVGVSFTATHVIIPAITPSGGSASHSAGSGYTVGLTASATHVMGTASYTGWAIDSGPGSVSPGSGSTTTLTIPPGGVGSTTFTQVHLYVTDTGDGSTNGVSASFAITWT